MSALAGIKVIELAHERISLAGKLLGDMGADVILVEPPGGAPMRAYPPFTTGWDDTKHSLHWWHFQTNKRSIELDLDAADDRELFRQLVKQSDVLLESEPINRLADLGVDWPDLQAANPALVHAAITPYGRGDPASDLPTTDLTLLAEGGPVWSCGYDDHQLPPVRGWGDQAHNTACHFAAMSVLTALLYREGGEARGQFIDISMVAALNVTTEAATYQWLVAGATVQRQTGRHASTRPSGETQMRCLDGRYVNTGVPPRVPGEFAKLLAWLRTLNLEHQLPEAVFIEMGANWDGPFDLSLIGRDDTVTAIFGAGREGLKLIAANTSAQDFFLGCQQAGLSVGAINSPEEAFELEHFKARGYQVEVYQDELRRVVRYPGAPYQLPASPWKLERTAPELNQHNEEIRKELSEGFTRQ